MGVILNGAKYSLPYNGACKRLRKIGACEIYVLKNHGGRKKVYYVIIGGKVAYSANTLKDAVKWSEERYGQASKKV